MASAGGPRPLAVHGVTRFGPPNTDWLHRVIGTTDINGKGTQHSLEREADPFVLLDEAGLPPGKKPPFGQHPHTGLVACTIPLSKTYGSMLWDNCRGEYGPLLSGGMFQIKAGRGVLHDEGKDPSPNVMRERYGAELLEAEKESRAHVLQLWFNPGIGLGREAEPSEVALLDASEIPEVRDIGGCIDARVLLGEYGGVRSPAKTWDAQMVLLECHMQAEAETTIALPGMATAWVYVLRDSAGSVRAACGDSEGAELGVQQIAISPGGSDSVAAGESLALKLSTAGQAAHFLVGAGKPVGLPWVKLLGSDGAMLGPSEDWVRAKMAEYEASPDAFGTGDAAAPAAN